MGFPLLNFSINSLFIFQLLVCRGVVEGVLRGAKPPLLKFPINLGGLSPPPPLKILIQTEIICDNMPNFSQFMLRYIWHYFTFEIQFNLYLCSIIEGQTSTCNFSYVQNGILINKPCSDCRAHCCTLSSYDKAMRCWKLCF